MWRNSEQLYNDKYIISGVTLRLISLWLKDQQNEDLGFIVKEMCKYSNNLRDEYHRTKEYESKPPFSKIGSLWN